MEVTMRKAQEILKISPGELKRRMASGELKWRKKTASKFSDTMVTIPDGKEAKGIESKVVAALKADRSAPEPEPVAEVLEAGEHQADEAAAALPETKVKLTKPEKRSLRQLIADRKAARAAEGKEKGEHADDEGTEEVSPTRRTRPSEPSKPGGGNEKAGGERWWFG